MKVEEQQIYWYSGLYLQPQHFQSLDLHHSFMLARCRQLSQPYNEGYYEISINDNLLKEFIIKIEKIKALLPSGYYLEYPGNCVIQDKCLSDLRCLEEGTINLWLALKRYNPEHTNVSNLIDKRGGARWFNSDEEIIMRNAYHESPDAGITRIKFDVQIITDYEKKNVTDCEFLPLVKVIHEKNHLIIDGDNICPVLRLSADNVLKGICSEIYSDIEYYKNKIIEHKHSVSIAYDSNFNNILILCIINRSIPLIEEYINQNAVHPWYFYIAVRQLISELSTFDMHNSSDTDNHNFSYNHYNQVSCFRSLYNYLKYLLNMLCRDRTVSIKFNKLSQDTLVCNIESCTVNNEVECYVKLMSNYFKKDSKYISFLSEIRVAPLENMDLIIQHALPGLTMIEIDAFKEGLLNRDNIIWLKLDNKSELWAENEIKKNIAFYWSYSPDDLIVEFVLSSTHRT